MDHVQFSLSLCRSIDGPADLPLTVSAEVMHVEKAKLTVDIQPPPFDLLMFGKVVNSVFWDLQNKSHKLNICSRGRRAIVYYAVSNPVKSGFASPREALCSVGSFGLNVCHTGTRLQMHDKSRPLIADGENKHPGRPSRPHVTLRYAETISGTFRRIQLLVYFYLSAYLQKCFHKPSCLVASLRRCK